MATVRRTKLGLIAGGLAMMALLPALGTASAQAPRPDAPESVSLAISGQPQLDQVLTVTASGDNAGGDDFLAVFVQPSGACAVNFEDENSNPAATEIGEDENLQSPTFSDSYQYVEAQVGSFTACAYVFLSPSEPDATASANFAVGPAAETTTNTSSAPPPTTTSVRPPTTTGATRSPLPGAEVDCNFGNTFKVRPAQIDFGCGADALEAFGGRSLTSSPHWSAWASTHAAGTGDYILREGLNKYVYYPATINLFRPTRSHGHLYFSRATVTFSAKRPSGIPRVYTYSCSYAGSGQWGW